MTDITWLQTASGKAVNPLDTKPSDVCIEDVAHHLSQINRFTGAARFPVSVALHSVNVSYQAARLARELSPVEGDISEDYVLLCARWGLLHDASEAYLSDVNRILKHQDAFASYREAERILQGMIVAKFGLPVAEPPEVKRADTDVLRAEAAKVMTPLNTRSPGWDHTAPDGRIEVLPVDWSSAKHLFLKRFDQLFGGARGRHVSSN